MDHLLMRNALAGQQAIIIFLLAVFSSCGSYLSGNLFGFKTDQREITYWGPALYFCLFNLILRYCYRGFIYEVCLRAAFLGTTFSTGSFFALTFDDGLRAFGLYVMVLSMFHYSEFMSVALTNPRTLTLDSFILNHSVQYAVAAFASWIEWGIEYYFFPEMKTNFWICGTGVLMCVGGELLRKSAMFTARTNFTHTVQFVKKADHKLVTHGVYSLCRHPSYVGWFYWSVGTQLILQNPVCLIIYAITSWIFFRERVYAEELTLLTFFGPAYEVYQTKVGTGLPFIKGYVPENTGQFVRDDHWSY